MVVDRKRSRGGDNHQVVADDARARIGQAVVVVDQTVAWFLLKERTRHPAQSSSLDVRQVLSVVATIVGYERAAEPVFVEPAPSELRKRVHPVAVRGDLTPHALASRPDAAVPRRRCGQQLPAAVL